jgi:MFS family permease
MTSTGYKYDNLNQKDDEEESLSPSSTKSVAPAIVDNGFLGYKVLYSLTRDAWILIVTKAIRLFSYGFLGVMLVIYLGTLSFPKDKIGLLLTLTLFGDAGLSMLLTTHADRWGRKKTLILGSLVAILTSFIFATQKNFFVLLISAVIGVISPSGNEIGPFMSIEISAISEVTRNEQRTAIMAWYNLFGSFSCAFGAFFCGFLLHFFQFSSMFHYLSLKDSCKYVLFVYGVIQISQLILFQFLSSDIEAHQVEPVSPLEIQKKQPDNKEKLKSKEPPSSACLGLHKSKWIVFQLSCLFMLDSFGGSFVLQSILSSWFYDTYATSPAKLGTILFYCNLIAGISSLFAVQIASCIGLIQTMVFTHLPSNVFLILVPLMPTELTAMFMICARFSISQMDVPTRNAYVQGVVDPDERSAANGVTNVVRSIGAAIGPYLCGLLMANPSYRNYPFYVAGGLKIVYDLLLLLNFYNLDSTSDVHKRIKNGDSSTNSGKAAAVLNQQGNLGSGECPVDEEGVELIEKK